jgi:hypothetical protein
MKATRIQGFSITIRNKEEAMIFPYLKQIKNLTLTIASPIENLIPDHGNVDSLRLLALKNLKNLELVFPDSELVPGLKLQPKNLIHLLTVFSDPEFKASVRIRASEFVTVDKTITVTIPPKGATHITSLKLGHVDEEGLAFLLRTSEGFNNLRELNFTLRMNKKNLDSYLQILPRLICMEQLHSLGISFMLPFFHFDAQPIFRDLRFPQTIKDLSLHFYPVAFCPVNELANSDFMNFRKELERLENVKNLSINFVVSEHMNSCYSLIEQLNGDMKSLENLKLKVDYHVEPNHTETNCVRDILKWVIKLQNLRDLELHVEFPNFFGIDRLAMEEHSTLKNLKTLVLRTPKEKTFADDNFCVENLGFLLKLLEPSYNTLELFELDVSSVNFTEECFGILLHAVSQMRKLKEFDCAIYEGEFTQPMFKAFEDSLKSLDSLDEIHLTTDVKMKDDPNNLHVHNGNDPGHGHISDVPLGGGGFFQKVSHLLDWRT